MEEKFHAGSMRSVNYALRCISPRMKMFAVIAQCSRSECERQTSKRLQTSNPAAEEHKMQTKINGKSVLWLFRTRLETTTIVVGVNFQPVCLSTSKLISCATPRRTTSSTSSTFNCRPVNFFFSDRLSVLIMINRTLSGQESEKLKTRKDDH